jgi:hypothetical protein
MSRPFSSLKLAGVGAAALALLAGLAWWWLHARARPIDDFMAEHYGTYDAKTQRWQMPAGTDGGAHLAYRICAQKAVRIKGEERILLAACGEEADADISLGMAVDLYVLAIERGAATPVASLEGATSDSGSEHSTGVEVVRLGSEFYGFSIDSIFMSQGYTIPGMTLFVPGKDGLSNALSMATGLDNDGTAECGDTPAQCLSVKRTVHIDDSAPGQRVYPIEVVESREPHGQPPKVRKAVLRFDTKQWRFIGPRDFELPLG